MKETAILLSIISIMFYVFAFAGIKIFFAFKGIVLHIIRVLAIISIIYGMTLILDEPERGGLLSGLGLWIDILSGFAYVLLGFILIFTTQLSFEIHKQIIENKHNIARLIPKGNEINNQNIEERLFVPPSEKLKVFCPSCHEVISNQFEDCPECGINLSVKTLKNATCSACGEIVTDYKAKFCTSCGKLF